MWDVTTEFGQRVERYLAERQIIWLVTTSERGAPQPSPVWFVRDGDTVLIYSRPDAPKVRSVAVQPQVALHFDTDPHGNDVVIIRGTAALDPDAPPPHALPAYVAKYSGGFASLNMTPEQFSATYSAALRVHISSVRGF